MRVFFRCSSVLSFERLTKFHDVVLEVLQDRAVFDEGIWKTATDPTRTRKKGTTERPRGRFTEHTHHTNACVQIHLFE